MQFSNNTNSMSSEFRQRAEELDISSFRALTSGIGLGVTRPARQKQMANETDCTMVRQTTLFKQVEASPVVQTRLTRQTDLASNRQKSPSIFAKAVKFMFAHGLDLFIVATTVCLAVIVAGAVFYFKNNGLTTDHRVLLAPLKVISRFGGLEILAFTYAIFATYWLVFKLAVGRTLGESFFTPKRVAKKAGRQKISI